MNSFPIFILYYYYVCLFMRWSEGHEFHNMGVKIKDNFVEMFPFTHFMSIQGIELKLSDLSSLSPQGQLTNPQNQYLWIKSERNCFPWGVYKKVSWVELTAQQNNPPWWPFKTSYHTQVSPDLHLHPPPSLNQEDAESPKTSIFWPERVFNINGSQDTEP